MHTILVVLAAAAQVAFYQAQVPSYGCTSSAEVAKLQSIRTDNKAFQMHLLERVFNGECIVVTRGAVVEGAVEKADATVLRIQAKSDPPGYMAPAADFKAKPAQEKK
jgi:hypothetical protein